MKKEYLILDTYIRTVSKNIKDRRIKKELKDELFSHLIEIYERNIALGMSDEEAQKDAVSHMGDSESVAETFKKIYPVSSFEYFKHTGKLLAFPLVLSILNCGTYRGIDSFWCLSIWLFHGLNRIKTVNKKIHTAYVFADINLFLQNIFFIARNNFLINEDLTIALSLILNLILILIYIYSISGLVEVRKQLNEPKSYSGLATASVFALILSFATIHLMQFIDNGNLGLSLLAGAISLLPAGLMYAIVSEDIDRLETGVPQDKKLTVKRRIFGVLLSVILIASLFSQKIFVFYQPIDYVIEDTQTNVSEIKRNLIDMGLPESIAEELPESEILKYKSATKLQIDSVSEDDFSDSHYTTYIFTLYENANEMTFRTLMLVDKFEDFNEKSYTELFVDYYSYESSDIFCKMLCDYEGATKELTTLKSEPIADDDFKDYHYIFPNTRNAENHRAYIGMTIKIIPSADEENFYFTHYYAQTSLDDINDPYEAYWTRDDDRFYVKIANPYYMPTIEYPTNQYIDDEYIDLDNLN